MYEGSTEKRSMTLGKISVVGSQRGRRIGSKGGMAEAGRL